MPNNKKELSKRYCYNDKKGTCACRTNDPKHMPKGKSSIKSPCSTEIKIFGKTYYWR